MRRAVLLLVLLSSSALFTAASASRVEYRVVAGDTAYSLARRFGVTVDALLAQNGLKTPDLKVGQVLVIDTPDAAPTPTPPSPSTSSALSAAPSAPPLPSVPVAPVATPPTPAPAASTPASPAATTESYTVAAGDTLFSLARARGLKVDDVVKFNNLASPDLSVGQVLQFPLPGTTSTTTTATEPTPPATARPAGLVNLALSFLGVPYVFGGTTPRGLDCSGLVLQVMTPLGVSLPRTSAAMFNVGAEIEKSDITTGDLLFFDTEGGGRVTHVGIAIDAESFVHANSYNGKVTVDKLAEKYYATRFLGARRVLPPVIAAAR